MQAKAVSTFNERGHPMINQSKCREVRIKRANTDWWINEKSIVGDNGMTYIVYMTDMGEIHIKEFDAKCSRTPSRDTIVCRLNCFYSDEHNSPAICILQDGRIVVAYTGHATTSTISYRITNRPYDIYSFSQEIVLKYEKSVTYVQMFENIYRHELWLFTRVAGVTWEFRYSKDGLHWSDPSCFLSSDAGGLFYIDIRKQIVPSKYGLVERWFFALYGHPRISADHTIHCGFFDADGWLVLPDGKRPMNLYGAANLEDGTPISSQIKLQDLSVVYESPKDTTVRLLEVAPTVPLRIGFATFELDKPDTITYYIASWKGNAWQISVLEEYSHPGFTEFFNNFLEFLLQLLAMLVIGLTVASPYIMKYFVAPEFYTAYRLIPLISFGMVFALGAGAVGTIFTAAKATKCFLYSSFCALFVCIVFNLLLIPMLGTIGAAAANMLTLFVEFLVRVCYAKKFVVFKAIFSKTLLIVFPGISVLVFYLSDGELFFLVLNGGLFLILAGRLIQTAIPLIRDRKLFFKKESVS